MVFLKWSEAVEGLVDKVDATFFRVLYKYEEGSIFPLSGAESYANINIFACSRGLNYWIFPE